MDPALVVPDHEGAKESKVIPFSAGVHTGRDPDRDPGAAAGAVTGAPPDATLPRLLPRTAPRLRTLREQPDGKLESALRRIDEVHRLAKVRHDPTFIRRIFETGEYPYQENMRADVYAHCMVKLQCELLKCQRWIEETGRKIVVLFEGRDAAGKGSTIKRFSEHMSPRSTRLVALTKPTEREQTQWYLQRFAGHLPAAGEICLFDRSWYNRAGVEWVMGFCTLKEYLEFMYQCPLFEQMLTRSEIHLFKYWFSVTRHEQLRRIKARELDPLKRWKLSANDYAAIERWDEYTRAKEAMFCQTDTPFAPWIVIKSDDKRRARINCMRHFLHSLPYPGKESTIVTSADPLIVGTADYVIGRKLALAAQGDATSHRNHQRHFR
jgi:polyphosphate kinase